MCRGINIVLVSWHSNYYSRQDPFALARRHGEAEIVVVELQYPTHSIAAELTRVNVGHVDTASAAWAVPEHLDVLKGDAAEVDVGDVCGSHWQHLQVNGCDVGSAYACWRRTC